MTTTEKPKDSTGLCNKCHFRADSRKRAADATVGNPILDPAPRAECKRHEGYGHPLINLTECWDFVRVGTPNVQPPIL